LYPFTGIEGAIQRSEPKNPPDFGVLAAAETMIAEARNPETTNAEAGQWGGAETILLVEDEAFVREVTAEILESAGYRLMIARRASEALELYHKCSEPVDLLLADVVLPGMSGRELAKEFESTYPRPRVLLMSGYAEQLTLCESSHFGKPSLAKPFTRHALLRKVRTVLDTNLFDSGEPA
jgi:two-component system, cell cycle sensor histidine kinase and response regulator CckA